MLPRRVLPLASVWKLVLRLAVLPVLVPPKQPQAVRALARRVELEQHPGASQPLGGKAESLPGRVPVPAR